MSVTHAGPEVGMWDVIVTARDGQLEKDRTNGISFPPPRQRRGLGFQKGNEGSNPTRSATQAEVGVTFQFVCVGVRRWVQSAGETDGAGAGGGMAGGED